MAKLSRVAFIVILVIIFVYYYQLTRATWFTGKQYSPTCNVKYTKHRTWSAGGASGRWRVVVNKFFAAASSSSASRLLSPARRRGVMCPVDTQHQGLLLSINFARHRRRAIDKNKMHAGPAPVEVCQKLSDLVKAFKRCKQKYALAPLFGPPGLDRKWSV